LFNGRFVRTLNFLVSSESMRIKTSLCYWFIFEKKRKKIHVTGDKRGRTHATKMSIGKQGWLMSCVWGWTFFDIYFNVQGFPIYLCPRVTKAHARRDSPFFIFKSYGAKNFKWFCLLQNETRFRVQAFKLSSEVDCWEEIIS